MTTATTLPAIIQGGMGVAVSDWRLARAVARTGQLGVVSGTAIDTVMVRRLQDGDPGGHVRRAMAAFPFPDAVKTVLERYFRPEGRPPGNPYRLLSMPRQRMSPARQMLCVLAAFVEVHLAREGHDGQVGINLLTKVQAQTLPTLYGAMLAGVEAVLMGAGIPREIPGVLDRLARHEPAAWRFEVEGLSPGREEQLTFDPAPLWQETPPPIARPAFLAIIASNSLATMLARKASGRIDGFVIEGPTAGGHNAPPRGPLALTAEGEPIYGDRDVVDLQKVSELGLPFWIAGGSGRRGALAQAQAQGAAGIQVGTLFAYAEESGLAAELKSAVLGHLGRGDVTVRTDPRASPTGYPFKVVRWPGAPDLSTRQRHCDLGYLRVAYQTPEGRIGYRCASEPVDDYVRKGGSRDDTEGRQCLCNALTADIGQGQLRDDGTREPPLITSGDDLTGLGDFLGQRETYTAADVVEFLLG
ncbi:MAG TPA: nitronate monooxygenase [Actinomycetota bacterium]|nr:nitronate monooxygenase [Actinomycetota bacterium]